MHHQKSPTLTSPSSSQPVQNPDSPTPYSVAYVTEYTKWYNDMWTMDHTMEPSPTDEEGISAPASSTSPMPTAPIESAEPPGLIAPATPYILYKENAAGQRVMAGCVRRCQITGKTYVLPVTP